MCVCFLSTPLSQRAHNVGLGADEQVGQEVLCLLSAVRDSLEVMVKQMLIVASGRQDSDPNDVLVRNILCDVARKH